MKGMQFFLIPNLTPLQPIWAARLRMHTYAALLIILPNVFWGKKVFTPVAPLAGPLTISCLPPPAAPPKFLHSHASISNPPPPPPDQCSVSQCRSNFWDAAADIYFGGCC